MHAAGRGGAVAALLGASALWGTIGLAASLADRGVPAGAVGAAGMGLGGLLLLALAPRRAVAVLRAAASRRWALAGALGVIAYPLALYPSMRLAGVALANVVALGSGPVFAALLEWAIDRRRPSPAWVVAAAAAVLGVLLLALGRGEAVGGGASGLGVLLALLAGLGYAWYAFAAGRAVRAGAAPTPVMAAMFGSAGVVLVPVALLLGGAALLVPPTAAVVGYLAVGPLAVAYLLFGRGIAALPATAVTTLTLVEPVVATTLAVLLLHERLGPLGWCGVALVLAALLAVVLVERRRP